MSTRSGRRIHGSFHEPEVQVDVETTSKSVKKTRNKRLKDNKEVLETTVSKSKKRNNYVSYPSDEEALGVCEVPKETKDEPSRGMRKIALKEQNLNISNLESVDIVTIEKPVRLTRRTKRFVEDDSDQNAEKEVPNTVTLEGKKSMKNKKKKSKKEVGNENAVARKSKRKKKKSDQDHENDKSSALNGSNMSVESFHSAAGSPIHVDVNNILNSTFEKSPEEVQEVVKNTVQTNDRKSRSIHNSNDIIDNFNVSVTKTNSPKNKRASRQNSTFEITDIETNATATKSNTPNKRLTRKNSTLNNTPVEIVANSTFEKEKRRSSIKNGTFNADSSTIKPDINTTFDKNKSGTPSKLNATFEKEARRRSLRQSSTVPAMNSTYEKEQSEVLNSTFDKETKLNSTFDKNKDKSSSNKSSLVTSDDTCNLTFDKSDERISITSDDSRIENTTPVLIESSLDESHINTSSGKKQSPKVSIRTPLKREGTFTKDGPEVESKSSMESVKTPTKRISIATPGSTPFPFSKSGQKERAMLNVTRSIEKSRLSVDHVVPAPRMTRVMFCSPVNNPVVVAQQKRKVIKSNLKGSNKSFVFEESGPVRAVPRKRSYTHNDAEDARAHVKRTRLNDDMQSSVDRLSRPRTSSTKPAEPTTPSKRIPTPSKSKSESKVSRTKLPNFAALHQRRFEKMESLDECQQRKAKRAKQLLTPSAPVNVLERSSPRVSDQGTAKEVKKDEKKPEPRIEPKATRSKDEKKIEVKKKEDCTKEKKKEVKNSEDANSNKSQLTLDSLKRGYTRFGFKMNIGVNPFSVPRTEVKVKEVNLGVPKADGKIKGKEMKNGLTRQVSQPSLAGTTLNRKEAAKQLVMREKSFTRNRDLDRKEARTVIRGVRTNRRFELQMQMRNIS